jgi:hypothetical protein
VIGRRTPLFTARCRPPSQPAYNIKHEYDSPQPAADDKR